MIGGGGGGEGRKAAAAAAAVRSRAPHSSLPQLPRSLPPLNASLAIAPDDLMKFRPPACLSYGWMDGWMDGPQVHDDLPGALALGSILEWSGSSSLRGYAVVGSVREGRLCELPWRLPRQLFTVLQVSQSASRRQWQQQQARSGGSGGGAGGHMGHSAASGQEEGWGGVHGSMGSWGWTADVNCPSFPMLLCEVADDQQ